MHKKLLVAALILVPVALILRFAIGSRLGYFEAEPVPLTELLEVIPAELRYTPEPLKPEANGWPALLAASKAMPRVLGDDARLLELLAKHPMGSLGDAERKQFDTLFARERESLAAAHEAAAKPAAAGPIDRDVSPVDLLREFQTMVTVFGKRGLFRIRTGEKDAGIQDLIDAHRVGERILEAGGPTYFSSLATSLLQRAERDMLVAAELPEMDEAGLSRLIAALPSSHDLTEAFQQSMRSELRDFAANEVSRLKGPGADMRSTRKLSPLEAESGWRDVDTIAQDVLDGHPNPFDRKETMKAAVEIYRALIQNIDLPWARQEPVPKMISELVGDWPTLALSGAPLGHPAVRRAIDRNRSYIMKSKNPYGRLAVWFFLPVSDQSRAASFRCRAGIEGTRLSLAMSLYAKRNGALPGSLEKLREAKILVAVPSDPFSDGPFRYDPKAKRIWSVGIDGTDDGGDGDAGTTSLAKDLVWDLNPMGPEASKPIVLPPAFKKGARSASPQGFGAGPGG